MTQKDTSKPGRPTVRPGLFYKDLAAAYEYLVTVFGFEAGEKIKMRDGGALVHADVWIGDQCVMLFEMADWNPAAGSPAHMNGDMTQMVHVDVPDLDATHAHIVARGGQVMSEPGDMFYGDRIFWATDLEGHAWAFHPRDFAPKEPEHWGEFDRAV